MKRKLVTRMLITMMVTALVAAPLSACSSQPAAQTGGYTEPDIEVAAGAADGDEITLDTDSELLESIKTSFAASELPEEYNQPMLGLALDHVFEFECSEAAGERANDAFKVYTSTKFVNVGSMEFNDNEYENGKITVRPDGALYLDGDNATNIDDGTWGSLSELYLVQYIDLETGEDLEKPIVTPFTIRHEVATPIVTQGVDENNNYMLSWPEVPGAVEYRIYENFSDYGYKLECTTKETSVSSNAFKSQERINKYAELISNDLKKAGYPDVITEKDGVTSMNYAVKYEAEEDGYFLVVAVDAEGNQSGTSNILDVRDVAMKLPYQVKASNMEVEVESIEDFPTYVEVEMIDGSVQQMVIDYHGADAYTYEDPEKLTFCVHVANTLFDKFLITTNGLTIDEVKAEGNVLTERQDELLRKLDNAQGPDVNVTYNPSEEADDAVDKAREEMSTPDEPAEPESTEPAEPESTEPAEPESTEPAEPESTEPAEPESTEPAEPESTEPAEPESTEPAEPESTEPAEPESTEPAEPESTEPAEPESTEPAEPESTEPAEPEPTEPSAGASEQIQLLNEVSAMAQLRLNELGSEQVSDVMYASNDLQAWMAICLITQMEVIPIPVEAFPDAGNLDYAVSLFTEAYRQNPTSGVISEVGYSSEYQTLVVKYTEDANTRLSKAKQELSAAYEIKNEIITEGMSDYDKVLAINEYFRENASYDFDSAETDVDLSNLSEQFIDAHTPYGIIVNNYGVCESYSEAFVLVARVSDMEAMCEIGTLYGGGHEWNRVLVDGSWCILDITNNDVDTYVNGLFNVTDAQVAGILVPDNAAIRNFENYAANDETKEYYYVNGLSVNDLSEADELLAELLETSDCVVIRIPAGSTKEELEAVIGELVNVHEVNFREAGAKMNLLCVTK